MLRYQLIGLREILAMFVRLWEKIGEIMIAHIGDDFAQHKHSFIDIYPHCMDCMA